MIPHEYLAPYFISNAVALALIFVTWKWPRVARYLFALIFAVAAVVNAKTANITPELYLEYADLAFLDWYRQFITGWFAANICWVVTCIAAGQFIIAILLLLKPTLRRLGIIGAILFLTGIAPLGVGSAFPFSIWAIIALVILWRRDT